MQTKPDFCDRAALQRIAERGPLTMPIYMRENVSLWKANGWITVDGSGLVTITPAGREALASQGAK